MATRLTNATTSLKDMTISKRRPSHIVRDLVLNEGQDGEKRTVYIVGESNFTFSLALAALRGSWDGIITTSFHHNNLLETFSETKALTLGWCILNQKKKCSGSLSDFKNVEDTFGVSKVLNVEKPPEKNVIKSVDCTTCVIPTDVSIVLFQCPWKSKQTSSLLRRFFTNIRHQQHSGDYILIGIVRHRMYIDGYNMEKMSAWSEGYVFVGEDSHFIGEILKAGYKHQCESPITDIHEVILHHHATLVFQKK